jgi:hypothetical protein
MLYYHTQKGWLHWILLLAIGAEIPLMWMERNDQQALAIMLFVAAVLAFAALCFRTMTVRDEGDALGICYGPLPLFQTRIPYDGITSVEPDATSLIDGWGIHYIPWRGWTYNLWGFSCARIQLGNRVVRIGSDDVDNLVSFLRRKVPASSVIA